MSNSPPLRAPSTLQEMALYLMLERHPFGFARLNDELRVEEVSFRFLDLLG